MAPDSSPFATARTVIAIAGLAFAAGALGAACLDHFDEGYGVNDCPTSDGGAAAGNGADCGAPAATTPTNSGGSGNEAAAP